MQGNTRRDAGVTTQARSRAQRRMKRADLFCAFTLRPHWLISEANNTIPPVARSIIVGHGLHYKALDCGLDGPLRERSGVCQNRGSGAKLRSQAAEMKGSLGLLDLVFPICLFPFRPSLFLACSLCRKRKDRARLTRRCWRGKGME